MLLIALKPLLWSSAPRSSLRRQRGCARWPDRGVGTDPCHIPHADGGDLRSQAGVVAVAGIHQDHTLRPSGRSRRFDLLKGDLGLGLKNARLRHFGFVPSRLIRGPIFRQIELIRDRQAGIMIGQRQRHCDLAVILLAELTAYCRVTPTECRPFLGKPVSSTIQASTGPLRSIAGSTSSPTLASIAASDHGAFPTK